MRYQLSLFVAGDTGRSQYAIDNLRELCERELFDRYDIEIVDVLDNPGRADAERIVVTPTLVREKPEPVRKVFGDLSDYDQVLIGLDLPPSRGWVRS